MALLPTLSLGDLRQGVPIVDARGMPSDVLLRIINGNSRATASVVNEIGDFVVDLATLNGLVTAAQTAADEAQAAAAAAAGISELTDSYVSGLTITATDAGSDVTISVSAHTRHYPQPDGTTRDVSVNAGSVLAQPYSTNLWIYYDQASRAGGAVTYAAATAPVAQVGDRHSVGGVATPAALGAPVPGKPVRAPGYVEI
jgi:hypothetical protein